MQNMKDTFVPVTRKNDIVVQEIKGETLIYDLKSNKAFCLNETSAIVWQLCDGNRSISDISDDMSVRLKTLVSGDFVALALDQFDKDDLLAGAGEKSDKFGGVSRREVIRKVGFASVVALPMVSSLVAPKASMAQSMAPLIVACQPCTTDAQCASGNCVSNDGVCSNGSSTVFGVAPGSFRGCLFDSAACDTDAASFCCSGVGVSSGQPCNINVPSSVTCNCGP